MDSINQPSQPSAFGEIQALFDENLNQLANLADRVEAVATRLVGETTSASPGKINSGPDKPTNVVASLRENMTKMETFLSWLRDSVNRLEEL